MIHTATCLIWLSGVHSQPQRWYTPSTALDLRDGRYETTALPLSVIDVPREDTVSGLRDRAILSGGLPGGFHRSEIAGLKVRDLHENRG